MPVKDKRSRPWVQLRAAGERDGFKNIVAKNAGFQSAGATRRHNQMATRIHLFAAGLLDLVAAPEDGRAPLRSAADVLSLLRLWIKQDAQE
jgi:hypothetical protein